MAPSRPRHFRVTERTIAYANGVATTSGYSPQLEWLNTVSTVRSATTLQSATYTRDAMGRITAIDGKPGRGRLEL